MPYYLLDILPNNLLALSGSAWSIAAGTHTGRIISRVEGGVGRQPNHRPHCEEALRVCTPSWTEEGP